MGSSWLMPIGAPGKPTFVEAGANPCWPVRNAARPAVQLCSP